MQNADGSLTLQFLSGVDHMVAHPSVRSRCLHTRTSSFETVPMTNGQLPNFGLFLNKVNKACCSFCLSEQSGYPWLVLSPFALSPPT